MAKVISKGDTYELRVARLLHVEGAFVRRAIDLNMRFGEDLTVTDLDILALTFSGDLRTSRIIGESKTAQGRKGPKLADRLLWLVGLRDLVHADTAFIATAKNASEKVRGLAERLDINVIDERDLLHRERQQGLSQNSPWGPFDPRLLERQREVYDTVKDEVDLKRVYWFARSEFWLLDPTSGIKRAFGAMRVLAKAWDAPGDDQRRSSLQWLARQTQVNVVVGLVALAGRCYREEPEKSSARLLRELASGPGLDFETLLRVSGEVDRYITAILRDLGADPGRQVSALGAFNPTPPSYAEPLLEVVQRLGSEPRVTAQLPRFIDVRLAEAELGEGLGVLQVEPGVIPDCERLLRLVCAFLVGQLKLDPVMLASVMDTRQQGSVQGDPPGSGELKVDDGVESENPPASERLFDGSTESFELH
jgi:hypothetical protein